MQALCSLSSTVSNRRAPPPVPPRTASKPLISVTLQSSTESAQDTYLDQQDRGSEANSQSGRSNSSDSLCSIRTGSLAKGSQPPPAPVLAATPAPSAGSVPPVPAPRDLPPPTTTTTAATTTTSTSTQSQNDTLSISVTLEQPPTAPKRKLSSIGIQVRIVYLSINLNKTGATITVIFDLFSIVLVFSGGLCSARLERRTSTPDYTPQVSVNWSSSGERQAVSISFTMML